jgi:dTDP-4-dehydrorhamnose reductase
VLIFGSYGMAGHVITTYFTLLKKYKVVNVDLIKFNDETIIADAMDKDTVQKLLEEERPDVVINCIGILISASKNKPDIAIYLNSYFPHQLEMLGKKLDFKIIHMSTDCVFSGNKGQYSEKDFKDGNDTYARSKALGEIINSKDLTFRMSIIGPELRSNGTGLFDWFMKQTQPINGYSKVFWTGITTLELAKAMEKSIDENLTGLYHLVPKEKISKYDLLCLIKEIWNRNIEISSEMKTVHDKSLVNNRKDFKFVVGTYKQMLMDLHLWMKEVDFSDYSKYHSA